MYSDIYPLDFIMDKPEGVDLVDEKVESAVQLFLHFRQVNTPTP